ncbi:hypothetical protein BH11ARM1_BH11ARM1_01670 [soil metagenome]
MNTIKLRDDGDLRLPGLHDATLISVDHRGDLSLVFETQDKQELTITAIKESKPFVWAAGNFIPSIISCGTLIAGDLREIEAKFHGTDRVVYHEVRPYLPDEGCIMTFLCCYGCLFAITATGKNQEEIFRWSIRNPSA